MKKSVVLLSLMLVVSMATPIFASAAAVDLPADVNSDSMSPAPSTFQLHESFQQEAADTGAFDFTPADRLLSPETWQPTETITADENAIFSDAAGLDFMSPETTSGPAQAFLSSIVGDAFVGSVVSDTAAGGFSNNAVVVPGVPEPSTALLLVGGLVGAALVIWRKRKSSGRLKHTKLFA